MSNGENILDRLDPAFLARLSPEALKKLSEVKLTKEGGIPEMLTKLMLGRSGYSTLFNQIYLEPGASQRTIQHEALHPLTRRPVIDLNPGAYFSLTPEQKEEMKKAYLGPNPSLWNKIAWGISGRFDETIPTQWDIAGGNSANLPPKIVQAMQEKNILRDIPVPTAPQSIDRLLGEQMGTTQLGAESSDRVMLQTAKRLSGKTRSFLFPAKKTTPFEKIARGLQEF